MVLNSFGGYNPYPNDPSERMRAAMATAPKMPTPMPDQGLFPNERAHQFAGQLLDQEIGPIANILRSAITRAYMAGWSAALDVADSGRLVRNPNALPPTPTGVEQVAEAVAPMLQKIVQDALLRVGTQPPGMPMRQPDPLNPNLPAGWSYIYHKAGHYPCHKPAFILTRNITEGEYVDPTVFRYLSGLPIPTDARSTCGSCGQEVHPYSNADLDWTPHIISNVNRTLSGHFIEPNDPPRAAVSPEASQAGDYGFPVIPDPQFNVGSGDDIPNPHDPGEFSDLEMQEILKLKAETDAALSTNLWLDEPDGRTSVSGS